MVPRQIFFEKTKIRGDQLVGKDNRNLVASEENQKLSQEEIMKMKGEGLSGQEIVGKLVEQSETFKTKTEFSQEKYIKKKKKK
nr:hypothetical protein BaRGS_012302 [Batillaria attramentaria]